MIVPNVGEFRHRVTWQTPSTTQDDLGQVNADNTYTVLGTRRAKIETIQTQEQVVGLKPEGTGTLLITQRWLDGLQYRDEMIWDDPKGSTRTFQVIGINDWEEQHLYQEVTVVELRS